MRQLYLIIACLFVLVVISYAQDEGEEITEEERSEEMERRREEYEASEEERRRRNEQILRERERYTMDNNTHSPYYWRVPNFAMAWLQGENVCMVEQVSGTSRKYYQECMSYQPRFVCGKRTYMRYQCCQGFERVSPTDKDCLAVKPIENLKETAQILHLREFNKFIEESGADTILEQTGPYTLFVPENSAVRAFDRNTRNKLEIRNDNKNLLMLHVSPKRVVINECTDNELVETLHYTSGTDEFTTDQGDEPIRINRYANGITTANCARIIWANKVATNGLIHLTEKVIEPYQERGTVMDILLNDRKYEDFSRLVIKADLNAELSDPESGPYTIFAPTNAALRRMDQRQKRRIEDDDELLKRFIRYHMLTPLYCSAAIIEESCIKSEEGQKLNMTCNRNDAFTVNDVNTVSVDTLGTNGVVHGLDNVLLPDSVKSLGERLGEMDTRTFSNYAAANLRDILEARADGNYTVFAPNEEAFREMGPEMRRRLDTTPELARRVVQYHVVPGRKVTKDIIGETMVPSYTERNDETPTNLRMNVYQKGFGVNNADIVDADNEVGNGVIHVIDSVMFPPEHTLMKNMERYNELSTFQSTLQIADMESLFEPENGNFTIFAPTNDAFENLDEAAMERLMLNEDDLKELLKCHVVDHHVFTHGFKPKLHYREPTLTDDWIDIRSHGTGRGSLVINGRARIVRPDIEATNGVMHVIDNVINCPSVPYVYRRRREPEPTPVEP